jgi:hypothetical protein
MHNKKILDSIFNTQAVGKVIVQLLVKIYTDNTERIALCINHFPSAPPKDNTAACFIYRGRFLQPSGLRYVGDKACKHPNIISW